MLQLLLTRLHSLGLSNQNSLNEKDVDGNEFSLYQNRGEPDGQQNAHKSASLGSSRSNSSTSSISGMPCSRSTIGRSLLDSEMIEEKLKQMSIQPLEEDMISNDSCGLKGYLNNKSAPVSQYSEDTFPHATSESFSTARCKSFVTFSFQL